VEGTLNRLAAALCAVGITFVQVVGLAQGEENPPPTLPSGVHLEALEKPPTPDTVTLPSTDSTPQSEASKELETVAEPCPVSIIRVPEMFGDQAPIGSLLRLPSGQILGTGNIFVPSARYFKISDNDSPLPQSRTYFSFNYFYNLNDTINQQLGGAIQHTRIHREIFGVEWAEDDQSASWGLRLPIDTFNADHTVPGLDGTSTDIGDLSIVFKWLLWRNQATGSLLSGGLAVTPPTGPGSFGGSNNISVFHNTILQPYLGWIWVNGPFYLQGFSAVDAPTDLNDVVLLDNSVAAGFFLYQNKNSNGLSAIVPTVEVHVNTPLNHRGVLRLSDPAGTPDLVDITGGIHFEYQDKSSMGIAFAVPVTGPRMFDFEILAQFRWRY
jgi:hypothetical protein